MSVEGVCATCGATFQGRRGRKYCSRPCRPSSRPYAPAPGEIPQTGDLAEVLALLWVAAHKGSVAAMRMLRDEMKGTETPNRPASVIDMLAKRRGDGR